MINFSKSLFYPNLGINEYPVLNRYPNPYSSHVKASDTLKSYTEMTCEGKTVLIIERLHSKTSKIKVPWIKSKYAYIMEKVVIGEDIKVYTLNISHKKFMTMLERQLIQEKTQFNKKYGKHVPGVAIQIETSIHSWNSWVEGFCLDNYKENVMRAQKGMLHVLEKMGWKVQH